MNIFKYPIAAATILLAGCTVGPNFTRPDAKLPTQWCASACQAKADTPSKPAAAPINTAWWTSFNDPELVALENRVASSNLDLKVASLRLAESRAERSITAADQYPTVNGNASATRERASANGVMSASGAIDPASDLATSANGAGTGVSATSAKGKGSGLAPFNLFQAGFDASWELDLWGRVRREIEAADASVSAQEDSRRDLLMSTMAEVARDYIQLRGTQTDYAITMDNLNAAKDIARVTRERKANGLASELDVVEADSQVSAESALLPQLEQQEDETINRLSFLLGEEPGALRTELETSKPIPPVPPVVPVGIPSDLARRRPDIREAEANLHQATAEIGVATADFYPSITLSGSASLQSLQFSQLGNWGSRQFGFGPSISLPIFEGGRLKATLNLRKEQQQEAAINYQRVVLSAWHDIDNALTEYSSQQLRHDQLQATVVDDQKALRLAQVQYTAGTGSFLEVLDAQRSLLSAQQNLTDNTTQISTTLVSLYKALGGGWESTYPDNAPMASTPSLSSTHKQAATAGETSHI
jgi:NodT family efflux transporter outer membrane factor (OMF) lipoprotein